MTDPIHDPDLRPGDHYKCLGDDEWHTVPELRIGVHQEEKTPAFAKPQDAVTAAAAASPYTPPDAYAADLAKLRAANATPESRFEDEYKARRRRELGLEAATVAAGASTVPRMTAAEEAELARYAPPDPYAAGIAALRAKEAR